MIRFYRTLRARLGHNSSTLDWVLEAAYIMRHGYKG